MSSFIVKAGDGMKGKNFASVPCVFHDRLEEQSTN